MEFSMSTFLNSIGIILIGIYLIIERIEGHH